MIIDKRPKPPTTPVAPWHSSDPSHPPPAHPATRPRGEVTFWIAPQVGKISNGAYLHMADSVHTSFVWREWFPTGPLAGLSRLRPHSGDGMGRGGGGEHPAVQPVSRLRLADRPRLLSPALSLRSPLLQIRSPASSFSLCFSRVLHAINFQVHFSGCKLQRICATGEWITQPNVPSAKLDRSLRTAWGRYATLASPDWCKSLWKNKKKKKQKKPLLHLVPLCSQASSPSNKLHETAL